MIFISIRNFGNLDAIGDEWYAMRFNQSKKNHLIRFTLNSQNRIERPIERLYSFGDGAVKSVTSLENNPKIFP